MTLPLAGGDRVSMLGVVKRRVREAAAEAPGRKAGRTTAKARSSSCA